MRHLLELHSDQLESFLLEPLKDVTDKPTVDSVRLDHDEGTLVIGHGELGG